MASDIIFLYDQVIETLTRLHAFWSTKVEDLAGDSDVKSDVDSVADLLAKRDLLTFAASTRNFAEACKSVSGMRTIQVPTCKLLPAPVSFPFFKEGAETITLYQLLSRILHSNAIQIFRSAHDYEGLLATSTEQFIDMIDRRRGKEIERSEPLIMLQGESDPITLVQMRTLVLRSCIFLNQVSDKLSEQDKVFLQRDYRDF